MLNLLGDTKRRTFCWRIRKNVEFVGGYAIMLNLMGDTKQNTREIWDGQYNEFLKQSNCFEKVSSCSTYIYIYIFFYHFKHIAYFFDDVSFDKIDRLVPRYRDGGRMFH